MNYRMDRLNSQMQKIISEIIQFRVKDPRVCGMVTVLSVECTKDLKLAKVVVSIYGEEEDVNEAFAALVKCSGFIRRELASEFKDIRFIPEIKFYLDGSMQYGAKIDKILEQIKNR